MGNLELSKIFVLFLESMVIVSAITNVFFSLIIIIIAIVELFFIQIGILDIVGIFLMGILNIIYACMSATEVDRKQSSHLL